MKNSGIGFLGLLQLVFLVLKLCGIISWSWWVVLIPLFVEVALIIVQVIIEYFTVWRYR